jgi:ABC-type lipoprotein export system ATPase subunit
MKSSPVQLKEHDPQPVLQLHQVKKHYKAPEGDRIIQVLTGVSLIVNYGESIAVMGPSGSGKSTLLNIMGALDYPSSGTVKLAAKNISDLTEKERARMRNLEIGFIFQLHHLLPQCTVLENVLIPTLPIHNRENSDKSYERARTLLDRVGLGTHLYHRPGQLSLGERQRVTVVRALINRPKLILADEPTGSLDQASADKLAGLLVELNREENTTLIVVTHAPEIGQRMGRMFKLSKGKLK